MHISNREGSAIAARSEVRHQPGKEYPFVLIATNGQAIATSEHYESHRTCLNGIDSVKRNADASIQDATDTNAGR
ncbi:YegP family protein [Streptomyces sp. NPDC058664]|uniref:YegP family protein n=1 Tax=unclassified Streptomyces TaxID=2593676 RepID=UPI00365103AF